MPEFTEKEVARLSMAIYLPISLGAALLFFLASSLSGDLTAVARIGGAAWIGLLSLIVSMPIVTARVRRDHGH